MSLYDVLGLRIVVWGFVKYLDATPPNLSRACPCPWAPGGTRAATRAGRDPGRVALGHQLGVLGAALGRPSSHNGTQPTPIWYAK